MILDTHDLTRCLQRNHRSEQVQIAAIQILDEALAFCAHNFPTLVTSPSFLSWSKVGNQEAVVGRGSAVRRWTCDLKVVGSSPGRSGWRTCFSPDFGAVPAKTRKMYIHLRLSSTVYHAVL